MYKKITHTIVEEHFSRSIENQIRSSLSTNEIRSQMPTTEIFDRNKFKNDVETYFKNYASKIISMTDATTGTEENLIIPFEELFKTIDEAGNMTKPFYSSDLGERINLSLRSLALTTFIAVSNAKTGRDPQSNFARINLLPNDLAVLLSSFNTAWNVDTVRNTLTQLMTAMQTKIKARRDKNSALEQSANASITNLLTAFASLLADGIITQHPGRFASEIVATITED